MNHLFLKNIFEFQKITKCAVYYKTGNEEISFCKEETYELKSHYVDLSF